MIRSEKQGHFALGRIAFPYLILCLVYAGFVLWAEEHIGDHIYKVSGQIGSVFGLAIAFFLSFRMNSAYDRWWEARKILGELTNNTRSFANKVYAYVAKGQHLQADTEAAAHADAAAMLGLLQGFVAQFGTEVPEEPSPIKPAVAQLIAQYQMMPENKISNEILLTLSQRIEMVVPQARALEKNDLMLHINRFYEVIGKAERIRNTPFLLIYSAFTRLVVVLYVLLTPVLIGDIDLGGEQSGLEFLAIPILAIIGTSFLTINRLANMYGSPFSKYVTSMPMQSTCEKLDREVAQVMEKCKKA